MLYITNQNITLLYVQLHNNDLAKYFLVKNNVQDWFT